MKCSKCNKKIMLEFKCRCEKVFCIKHKNPEDHKCTFDFVADAKKKLAKKNIKVVNEKLTKV